jgi:hypothetical protein
MFPPLYWTKQQISNRKWTKGSSYWTLVLWRRTLSRRPRHDLKAAPVGGLFQVTVIAAFGRSFCL